MNQKSMTTQHLTELPAYLTRFFGRTAELESFPPRSPIQRHARSPSSVPAGWQNPVGHRSGSPCLARVELRNRLHRRGDAGATGLSPSGDCQPVGARSIVRSAGWRADFRSARRSADLLVLDNMEHLLPASVDIAALLRALPELRVLATSRSPLHIAGERIIAVEPLATCSSSRATVSCRSTLSRSSSSGR